MSEKVDYVFLKQSAALRTYFGEICLDVPSPETTAVVFSEINEGTIGNLHFVPSPKYSRQSYGARVLSWAAYFISALWFVFRVKGRPLLFIVAQPPLLPALGYLQKKLLGRRYVVWVDDVYPDVLLRRGIIREGGWISRLWKAFNRVTFRNAEHVFTLSPNMLATVKQYLPKGFPATIVPTWVDTDKIYPIPRESNAWAKQHALTQQMTIMYSGNFGATHDVECLLEAARNLRNREDLCFIFIGAGSKWETIHRSVTEHGDSNVLVLPWQPSEVLAQSLSSADIAFVSQAKDIDGISMPSRTYYAMAAGAAIMASCAQESDLAQVVKKSDCGVIIAPGSVDEIVKTIEHLRSHPGELLMYKENARFAAVQHYSRKLNAQVLRDALQSLTGFDTIANRQSAQGSIQTHEV